MIPVNLEAINKLDTAGEAEQFRVLLSFINEYLCEAQYCGFDNPGEPTPVTSFIRNWMRDRHIEELPLYEFCFTRTNLMKACPNLGYVLARVIDSSWVWSFYDNRVNLREVYNDVRSFFRRETLIDRARRMLKNKGFHVLGSGAYSEVWGSDNSEWVYKINKGEDDGWCEYVTWATSKGYATTYAPRIHSLKKFGGFYIAKMEKLSKTLRDFRYSDDYSSSPLAQKEYETFDHIRNATYNRSLQSLDNAVRNHADSNFPGFVEFLEDMLKEFSTGLDLHDGNFMLDGRGFLVVTDPICTSSVRGASPRIKHGHVVTMA